MQPLVVDYNKNIVVTGGGNYIDGLVNSVEVIDTHNQVWKTTHSTNDDWPLLAQPRRSQERPNPRRIGRTDQHGFGIDIDIGGIFNVGEGWEWSTMDTHAIHKGRPSSLCRFCNDHHDQTRNSRRRWPRQRARLIVHDGVSARTIERRHCLLESTQSSPFGETGTGHRGRHDYP